MLLSLLPCGPPERHGTSPPAVHSLRQLALAMMAYASDRGDGRLPPAARYDKEGRPLLSWRVLLLPYLEQEQLYQQFHLDEPWDSPDNLSLLGQMPAVYAHHPSPNGPKAEPAQTFFKVFAGKGAAFEGREGVPFPEGFADGTSKTILLIEAGEPVPWTKPEDIPYAADQPLPSLATVRADCFNVAMADGHVVSICSRVSEKTLRAAITRNAGDRLGPDWDE